MRSISHLYLALIDKSLRMTVSVKLILLGTAAKTCLYDDDTILFKSVHFMFMRTKLEIVLLESLL